MQEAYEHTVDPTDVEDWLYCTILYKGLEYLWILVSARGPGTNPPQMLRDDICTRTESSVEDQMGRGW